MKRPSHATAIAYLALFIALGSGAYAATQLPKNSVGAKQLKKKAVTAAKLKNGAVTTAKIANDAVTGAKVDESTLGKVPSATTADNAATAANADNAAALNGIPSTGFLQASDIYAGFANPQIASAQPMFTAPGLFRLTTVGDGANMFKFHIENLSSSTWYFHTDFSLLTLEPGKQADLVAAVPLQETIVGFDGADPAKYAVLDCAYHNATPPIVFCAARVSPAA